MTSDLETALFVSKYHFELRNIIGFQVKKINFPKSCFQVTLFFQHNICFHVNSYVSKYIVTFPVVMNVSKLCFQVNFYLNYEI